MRQAKAEFDCLGFTFKMIPGRWPNGRTYLWVGPSKKNQMRQSRMRENFMSGIVEGMQDKPS